MPGVARPFVFCPPRGPETMKTFPRQFRGAFWAGYKVDAAIYIWRFLFCFVVTKYASTAYHTTFDFAVIWFFALSCVRRWGGALGVVFKLF